MLKQILPENIYSLLEKVTFDKISEVRLRANLPIAIKTLGQVYFLGKNGLTLTKENALTVSLETIEDIVYKASEFSIYSVNEELKQGYLVLNNGVRIGVAGTLVMEGGCVKTITNFSSLNIRIPHIVKGCTLPVLDKLISGGEVLNTLIVSPPGQGKTTFLRDFAYQLSHKNFFLNLLILDERGEIAGKNNAIDLGAFTDTLSFCTKKIGFLQGIRSLAPDIIFTDEIGVSEDFDALKFASNSGVKVIATIHAGSIEQLKNKPSFPLLQSVFERFVFLSPTGRAGVVQAVYNNHLTKI